MNIENIQNIDLENYQYQLAEERIAKFPVQPRDHSKLLIYQNNVIQEDRFYTLAKYLPPKSLLIFNDTKVIQARILFQKASGSQIEILLLEPHNISYEKVFQEKQKVEWKCMVGNAKKWKLNEILILPLENGILQAKWIQKTQHEMIVELFWDNGLNFSDLLEMIGKIPLPPYLNRDSIESDKQTYQTVYAKHLGAVAAPTAGLHFTENVFQSLKQKNISWSEVTLHVGAGTFKPLTTHNLLEHIMHQELCYVSLSTLKTLYNYAEHIIAIGTTSLRVLESIYWFVSNDFQPFDQWYPYLNPAKFTYQEALLRAIEYLEKNNSNILSFPTRLFIVPGYSFQSIQGIITNFHQPESTLVLLIAAWLGDEWKKVYEYALNHDFRFLSYGDSSLLLRPNNI